MIQYSDYIYFQGTNDPVVNALVTVMIANTQTPAVLYTDGTGSTPLSNPVTTDQTGLFQFFAAAGHYDLYYLGTKQFQIAINDTVGIPDPLNIQAINCTTLWTGGQVALAWSGAPDARVLIGTTTDDGASKLQVSGPVTFRNEGFVAPPVVPVNAHGLRLMSSSATGNSIIINTYSDVSSSFNSRIHLTTNRADGSGPIAGDGLGLINFNSVSSTGSVAVGSYITSKTAEQHTDTARGSYLAFGTNPIGVAGTVQRMMITSEGDVLINTTNGIPLTLAQKSLQLVGTEVISEEGLVYPYASLPAFASSYVIGATTNAATQANIVISDTVTYSPSFSLFRTRAGGALPVTADAIGRVTFGTLRPSTGGTWDSASISCYAEGTWAEPTPGNPMDAPSNLRFYTSGATGILIERMRLTSAGNMLIGGQVEGTLYKLQITQASSTAGGLYVWDGTNGKTATAQPSAAHVVGVTYNTATYLAELKSDTLATGARVMLNKVTAAGALPPSGSRVGLVQFGSVVSDGTTPACAILDAYSEGGWIAGTSHPGYLTFKTCPSGSVSPVERMRIKSTGVVNIALTGVPVYANNAAAITGGLVSGDLYRNGADPDHLCIVH